MNQADVNAMADKIEAYVREVGSGVSFVELDLHIDGFTGGDRAIEILPNLILWVEMTETATNAIRLLKTSGRVVFTPTNPLVYFIDGRVPKYPTASRPPKGGYKDIHWAPVCLGMPKVAS